MKFGAKYDLVAVFSSRMYIDNLRLPEYNSVKQSPYVLVPFDHVQSHTGFHSGALGLSIGRFCRAYDHARKHPDRQLLYMWQITRYNRIISCATTGADH